MITRVKTYHGPKTATVPKHEPVEAVQPVQTPDVSTPDLKAQLMEMGAEQRQQLLAGLFQSDIEVIVKKESERGYKQGFELGKKDAQSETDAHLEKMAEAFNEQQLQLEALLKNLKALTPEVQLKDEEVYESVTLAVFKLLAERLERGEYLQSVLDRAVEETLVCKDVVLCLSSEDYLFVQSHMSNYSESMKDKIAIQEDARLSIGDTRLELANGCIESSFSEKLQVWCKNLMQLHRGTRVG
ncbi:FliH/SctL family protein [Pseudoalteromonas sp. MMG022]|uniref:FliH/SctL family protein n=1 Tax=Pseudoalteromonas sp. MMG022 TaxID=2909978 RepID=UPI001F1D4353|nr:FliH/SctL family protein [Pseudoalteromonas sp. MMG022]MCF6436991.1 hypothetical protein [Pseudoalteromonas sp. MMG022]